MNFIEMIGFVISLLALLVLAGRKAYDDRRRRNNPEEYEREEMEKAERLKAFLKSVNMDMEDSEPAPPVQRKPKTASKQQAKKSHKQIPTQHKITVNINRKDQSLDNSELYHHPISSETSLKNHRTRESSAYLLRTISNNNRALDVISALKSKKDMIILQEIISPPKALR